MLPIIKYRSQIIDAIDNGPGSLIVIAPPGTGKSTQIPQFFIDRCTPGRKIVILEPRRIAARALAFRVSEELGQACGERVGYQVRFERKASPDTGILFLTYGTFLQMLAGDPTAADTAMVIFDEFHERSLDADAALAWVRRLRATVRPDLKVMVLSATLLTGELSAYLEASPVVSVPDRLFPVDLRYQPQKPAEPLHDQVLRALIDTTATGIEGSVLVFLPGSREIERAADHIHGLCSRRGLRAMRLHGRMPLDEQQDALRRPALEPCVILATNVAESSLTIPGVTTVIDCGLARLAGYDPGRERNTLYLGRISMQNAIQRAGRAGRLQPGVCVRLWSRIDESAMAPVVEPEVSRLDLAGTMLSLCNLQARVGREGSAGATAASTIRFLTPPPDNRWDKAAEELRRCRAIAGGGEGKVEKNNEGESPLFPLTKLGVAMSRLPLEPAVAAVLLRSRNRQVREICIAMAALWESGDSKLTESSDLFEAAQDFIGGAAERSGRGHGGEVRETCTQIRRLLGSVRDEPPDGLLNEPDLRREATALWLSAFSHRIGVRMEQGMVYAFADGRSARFRPRAAAGEPVLPGLLLALSIHEQAGRDTAKRVVIPLYLPLEEGWIAGEFGEELRQSIECTWDEARQGVRVEEVTRFRELILRRRSAGKNDRSGEGAAAILAEHLADCWDWRREEPEAARFVLRARLVGSAYPDRKIPEFSAEDWQLIYHGLCEGKYSLAEVRKDSMLRAIKAYLGPALAHFIEKKTPESIILPSGKKGRIGYIENGPPELSARLGDLIGHPAHFTLADGRVQGVFDILAPNYRTVQKTPDLGSFWKNTYPAIKHQLQRKYPKHPWP